MGKNQRNKQKQKQKQIQETQKQPKETQKQPQEKPKETQKQPKDKQKLPDKAAGPNRNQHLPAKFYETLIYQQSLANLKDLMDLENHGKDQVLHTLLRANQKLDMKLTLMEDFDALNDISNKVHFVFMESLLEKIEELEKQNELLKNKEMEKVDFDRKWEEFDMKSRGLMDKTSEIYNIQKWLQDKLNE